MTFVPVITVSFGYSRGQGLTHIISNQLIGEPLGAGSQISLDFCVECTSDILRVQYVPPAERDTEYNTPRQALQRDCGEEREYHTGYLPSIMRFVSADFERVAFDMSRASRAGANLDGTTRKELIIGERINPRNNIRADILHRY
jgi:hypothetical protein